MTHESEIKDGGSAKIEKDIDKFVKGVSELHLEKNKRARKLYGIAKMDYDKACSKVYREVEGWFASKLDDLKKDCGVV